MDHSLLKGSTDTLTVHFKQLRTGHFSVSNQGRAFNNRDKVKTTWVLFFQKRSARDCLPPPTHMPSTNPRNDRVQRLCRTVINTIQCAHCRPRGLWACTVSPQTHTVTGMHGAFPHMAIDRAFASAWSPGLLCQWRNL